MNPLIHHGQVRVMRLLPMLVLAGALAACGGEEPAPAPSGTTPAAGAVPTAPAETAPAAPAAPQTVAELLDAARNAMKEQRLVQPEGDNAIEYYLRVLEAEPDNRHAQLAILELMPLAQGVAEQMIETNRFDEATAALRLLKRAQPTSVVVTNLEQRIVQQRRAEDQRRQAEEEQARLAERQERERAAAEAATARAAAAAPPPAATPPRPAAQPAARPTPSAPAPATTTPAQPTQVASAAPAPSVASSTSPQNKDFQLVKRVNPTYPPQALRSRTEGWVELSFTITTDGNVEGVEVVNSEPRRIFDRDAIRALSQWKFSPRIEGGKPVAAKARQRLSFSLN